MNPYPLKFEPIFKPRVWGGRTMESRLGKHLPQGLIGESWELVDLEGDQSVVAAGPARGRTLSQLVAMWGPDLLGGANLMDGRFPLLLKYLDAQEPLSVQVHPDEAAALLAGGEVRVKHEAWYVLDAAPQAWILRGVRPGIDPQQFRQAVSDGTIVNALHRIHVRSGHAYYIPSGTVHALGPGLLIAEIQTPSDTTFRLFDWDRIDPATGKSRELHVEQALACVSYGPVPGEAEHPEHVASVWTAITRLITCDSFVVERVRMAAGVEQAIPYSEMVVWVVLEGSGRISCDGLGDSVPFGRGETVLLPAALKNGRVMIESPTVWLEITVPIPSALGNLDLSQRAGLRQDPRTNLVPLKIPAKRKPT